MAPYLMCSILKYAQLASLNLQRITALRMQERCAEVPADFDPQAMENAAFRVYSAGPLTASDLDFSPKIAPYIRERIWHPSQALEAGPEGRVRLMFTCAASDARPRARRSSFGSVCVGYSAIPPRPRARPLLRGFTRGENARAISRTPTC
ncbi:MAG: WYL domain-containing protein [Cytophagaceae bacterium]|nr:MAG: WYL domain-containing protein [Cytophagaceae bacterium]